MSSPLRITNHRFFQFLIKPPIYSLVSHCHCYRVIGLIISQGQIWAKGVGQAKGY
jgi:hypothetical protein